MKDGTFLEGTVVKEARDFIVLLTAKREKKVLSRTKIRRLLKGLTLLDIYVEKRAALPPGDAGAHLALGLWCETVGLRGLAFREFRKAVGLDPELEKAREKLGHKKWNSVWHPSEEELNRARGLIPFRGRWLAPEELEKESEGFKEHGGDWFRPGEWSRLEEGKAVAIPGSETWGIYRTLHYRLSTHLGRAKSLKFAMMAEQAFAAFHAHFGFAPTGVLEGKIFGDLEEFEDFVVGWGFASPGRLYSHGFFDAGSKKIYFPYIDDDYTTVNILIHELCHQFEVLARPRSGVPVWFFEGIACVFGHHIWDGSKLVPARLIPRKNFNLYYLQHLVKTGKHRTLKAILTGSPGAKVDPVFYNHAWGLTWFLMKCERGGYAGKFKKFEAAIHYPETAGKDPLALFRHHFGPLERVEKDFLAFIRGIKGVPWRGEGKPAGQK